MKNIDRIKQMTSDEMATKIVEMTNFGEYTCEFCSLYTPRYSGCKYGDEKYCLRGVQQWLESEEK